MVIERFRLAALSGKHMLSAAWQYFSLKYSCRNKLALPMKKWVHNCMLNETRVIREITSYGE